MGRRNRRNGGIAGMLEGFNQGYRMTGEAISSVQNTNIAKENQEEIETYSNPSDMDTEKFTGGLADRTPSAEPKKQYKFLGQTYDKPLSDEEIRSKKSLAMADVYSRTGQQDKAREMRNGVRQDEIAAIGLRNARRAEKEAERQDAFKADLEKLSQNTTYNSIQQQNKEAEARYQQELSNWEVEQKKGIAQNPQYVHSPAPSKPEPIRYGQAQALADQVAYLDLKKKHGQFDPREWLSAAKAMDTFEQEGYDKALQIAQAGGDKNAIAKAFNATGKMKIDPEKIISINDGKVKIYGEELDTKLITYIDENGKKHTINTAADLAASGKVKEMLDVHFKRGNIDAKIEGYKLGKDKAELAAATSRANNRDSNASREKVAATTTVEETTKDGPLGKETTKKIKGPAESKPKVAKPSQADINAASAYFKKQGQGGTWNGIKFDKDGKRLN